MRKKVLNIAVLAFSLTFIAAQVRADVGPTGDAPKQELPVVKEVTQPSNETTYQSTVTTTYESSNSEYNAGDKLARGLANILTSPLELPRNVQNTTEEQGVLVGWTGGMAQGIGMTALRIIVGAYEVITFPLPFPEGYKPVIEPEYVWEAEGPKLTPQGSKR